MLVKHGETCQCDFCITILHTLVVASWSYSRPVVQQERSVYDNGANSECCVIVIVVYDNDDMCAVTCFQFLPYWA